MEGWSALILAGGAGRRFGGGKLLADLAGAPVIRRVADAVLSVGFAEVIAITGAEDTQVRSALACADLRISHAPDWADGMAATLRKGIAVLAPNAKGVCVFLGDMPLVPVELCASLAAAAERSGYAARPRFEGKPGHPVAFTQAAFLELMALTGDKGASSLLAERAGVAYLDTVDCGVLLDIDIPEDLAVAARAWKA